MEDRHRELRELPFGTVIEALGYRLADYRPRKNGTEWSGKCPVHRPKRNSTAFSYSADGKWACFSCSASGKGAIDLVMKSMNVGFQAAVEFLEPLRGKISPSGAPSVPETVHEPLPEENEARSFSYEKFARPSGWLRERGLEQATLERFGAFEYFNPSRKSAYQGRILIRIQRFSDGGTVGYLVRDQRGKEERGDSPKYLFPAGVHKSLELWGSFQLKDTAPHRIVYLVESAFCVMRFHQLGLPAVAMLGCTLSERQADIIARIAKGVVALPDADKREQFAPYAGMLSRRLWVKCPQMPDGMADPEALSLEQIQALT